MPVQLRAAIWMVLALAAALWLIVSAIRRHRWSSLLRVVPALCLLAFVALLVPIVFGLGGPVAPKPFFHGSAPVPASANMYAIVYPSTDSFQHVLMAVSAQTGRIRWQRDMPGRDTYLAEDAAVYATSYYGIRAPSRPRFSPWTARMAPSSGSVPSSTR